MNQREENVYGELLKCPEWKALRVVISEERHQKCEVCGCRLKRVDWEVEGEVHHKKYTAKYPWLEPHENLMYVCHSCHENLHARTFGWQARCRNTMKVNTLVNQIKYNLQTTIQLNKQTL